MIIRRPEYNYERFIRNTLNFYFHYFYHELKISVWKCPERKNLKPPGKMNLMAEKINFLEITAVL